MSHIDVMKQALRYLQDNQHLIADNERHAYAMKYNAFIERFEQAIADAEKQQALDKKADNARELGLTYEQPECKYGNEPASCTSSPIDCQCAVDAVFEQSAQQKQVVTYGEVEQAMQALRYGTFMQKQIYEAMKNKPLYTATPAPAQQDIPDLIAGALGVSRGTAYEMMREALAEQPAPAQPLTDNRMKVKLGSQYGADLEGHWFYLQPADEFAEAALVQRTGITKGGAA